MLDVIIIGSGPAGLMSAIISSKNNKVLVLEKNNCSGKKLLITGGGRCNVTNNKNNKDFLEQIDYNKKYLYSTLNTFGPKDIIKFFNENNVLLKEEKENQIFPVSNKSSDILNALLNKIDNNIISYNEDVKEIIKKENHYEIITNKNTYLTKNVIVATGGSSYKNTGSTGDNIKFAKMLNQPVIKLFPAETSIITKEKNDLAGTSLEYVKVRLNKKITDGNLIFTHKGLSGTSIMKMSEHIYLSNEKIIYIDLNPLKTEEELKNELNNFDREKEIHTYLENYFTKKFSLYLLNKINIENNIKIKSLTKSVKENIINIIKKYEVEVDKVENIDLAYVTGGGIDMKYINTKTMESKINKGIYFVGEALDIHGPIGGYNITLALSTGYTAGLNIKK